MPLLGFDRATENGEGCDGQTGYNVGRYARQLCKKLLANGPSVQQINCMSDLCLIAAPGPGAQ